MKDKRELIMMILAFLGVSFPVVIILYLMIFGMQSMSPEITLMIGTLIGVIVGEYKTVFSYYFGSSSGSKSKQETIDKMTETQTPPIQ